MKVSRGIFFVIFGFICVCRVFAADSHRVPHGDTITIMAFGECASVTNNSPTGKDVFVPTKTEDEWESFKDELPSGVSLLSSSYSPSIEGNLRLWLDASDASTLFLDTGCTSAATSNGDRIACWKDKSGAGQNVTQGTSANRPTLNTAQMNGRNVVLFSNTAKPLAGTFTATTSGLHLFAILNYNTTGGSDRAYLEISTAASNRHFWIFQRYASNTNFTPTGNVDSLFGVSHPSGLSFTAYQDGVALQTRNSEFGAANGTYGNIVIGDDYSGGNQLYAKMGELLVFQGTMTQAVRERIEGYLAWKWGTQGRLGASHPYKNSFACP